MAARYLCAVWRGDVVTAFDRDYRRCVRPRLARYLEVRARMVADGIESLDEARGHGMALALNAGAGWLSRDAWDDLEAWVLDELVQQADGARGQAKGLGDDIPNAA